MARYKLRHLKHDTISLRDLPNTLTAALRIRGSVAAVMFGLIDNTATRVYMPRVAIDPAFTYYSPGLLLCAETVRHLAAHTTIRNLDLTRGEERYKYTMGGAPYNTRYFTLQP